MAKHNVFRIKETGDIATFRGGKPLVLQLGSLASQVEGQNFGSKQPGILDLIKRQTGLNVGSLPSLSVEDVAQRFMPGAHPNIFFEQAQTGSLADFRAGGFEPVPQGVAPTQAPGGQLETFNVGGQQVQALTGVPPPQTPPGGIQALLQRGEFLSQLAQKEIDRLRAGGQPTGFGGPKVGDIIPGTNLRYEAADIANLQSGPQTGFISSDDLGTAVQPKIASEVPPPITPIPKIKPPQKQKSSETSDLVSQLGGLLDTQAGQELAESQAVSKATAQAEADIIDITEQIDLLTAREEQLRQDLEKQTIPQPIIDAQISRMRRETASEALSLAARAAALQSKFDLAERQARLSVKEKFAEIEQDIRTKRRNILDNYDEMTTAQKKQADALLLELDSNDAFVKNQKAQREDIQDIAIDTAKELSKAGVQITAEALRRIQESDDISEALGLQAEEFAKITPKGDVDFSIQEVDGRKVRFGFDAEGNIVSRTDLGVAGREGGEPISFTTPEGTTLTLTSEQADEAISLGSKVTADPVYKDMTDIQRGLTGVFSGLSQGDGFGDVAAINSFQRMIDPGATVRAEDVVLLQTASAILQRVDPKFLTGKVTKGDKLPEAVREQMRKTAKDLYDASKENYNTLSGNRFNTIAAAKGIPSSVVGTNFPNSEDIIDRFNKSANLTDDEACSEAKAMGIVITEDIEEETPSTVGFWEGLANIFGL